MTPLGEELLELARAARSEFVMCAPFAKAGVVRAVTSAIGPDATISLYTRWRPEEIAAGVSDTAVLSLIEGRGGAVYLHDRLHAKFYRNEVDLLLGSANLTATALGWAPTPNLELLVHAECSAIADLETTLRGEAVQATTAMAHEVEQLAAMLPAVPIAESIDDLQSNFRGWLPSLRMPEDLYAAYSAGSSRLTSRSALAAELDLAVLELPMGLDKAQFYLLVGHRMLQQPMVRRLDEYLSVPRRFGEIRDKLAELAGFNRDEAEQSWQTVMRWMLEFRSDRYRREVFRTSEVMSVVGTGTEVVEHS